ncbi:MAG: carbamoyltransferase HypF, partial [Microcystaceae cyanobacterium]
AIILKRGTFLVYPFELKNDSEKELILIQWQPMIRAIWEDINQQVPKPIIAAKFHHTLAKIIIAIAQTAGIKQVLLTGGCFQNAYLLETAIAALKEAGFKPYWPQKVPTNDGGIALGQVLATIRHLQ